MFDISEKSKLIKKAFLIGVFQTPAEREESASLLDELQALVETLSIPVAEKQLIRISEPSSRYFVGSGKAEEIAARANELPGRDGDQREYGPLGGRWFGRRIRSA